MKNISKCIIALVGIVAFSCTDDVEDRTAVTTGAAPVLKSPVAMNVVLNHDTPDDLATTFVWDYATYNGTPTVINYAIEFDQAGNNFESPTTVATTINKYQSFTVGELNQAALDAGFPRL
ncbi:SusE domain-containing protein [Flavobacterium sp. 3HN19-14]|uniref:SusE domain-containing protein n=1 Tax=Flavobacterium sp. 3HN19-14 TaxID=3448133 RepID=UPI003EE2F6FD